MGFGTLIGRKIGMTRIFDEMGNDFPVTVLKAGPCPVVQIKTYEKEGYDAFQIGFEEKPDKRVNRADRGHVAKSSVGVPLVLLEVDMVSSENINLGHVFHSDIFSLGDLVTVSGVSKGKGFAGHMKRHGFSGGRRSHGKNSVMRKSGSVGAGTDPSRIWPGTRMAGRMGSDRVSVKNLEVVRVDKNDGLVFVKGAVPGAKNGIITIKKQ